MRRLFLILLLVVLILAIIGFFVFLMLNAAAHEKAIPTAFAGLLISFSPSGF